MISRRRLLIVMSMVLGAPGIAGAQQARQARRIGFLSPQTPSAGRLFIDTFRQRLIELGHAEGQFVIEERFGDGRKERYPRLAAELIQLKADVIIVGSDPGALAAKNAGSSVPIVFFGVSDPVALGLVSSLGHPGGHVTGVSLGWDAAFVGKWMGLLKEIVPNLSRAAVMWNPDALSPTMAKAVQEAGRINRVAAEMFEVTNASQFSAAFATMSRKRCDGLVVIQDPLMTSNRVPISDLAVKGRLPMIAGFDTFAQAGALMTYGATVGDFMRLVASYVDKILRGANAADLPVEQPTKLLLTINVKTARALGLTIPQSLLLRADRVIE